MRKAISRYCRGVEYLLRYVFIECPRGLDFSIRNKASGITLPGNHGYALTSKAALKNMLRHIPHAGKSLIDIGSGKGGVICFAYELGLSTCLGVEYEEHLHRIAEKNIERLGYRDHVRSVRADARNYQSYADFDTYFLFNPFDYDIYADVINSIVEQNRNAQNVRLPKFLVCYGDANIEAVHATNAFSLLIEERCPYRGNNFRIFELKM
ncbi:SAM-dependent methyltransferase [Mesorhizobium sp. A623]